MAFFNLTSSELGKEIVQFNETLFMTMIWMVTKGLFSGSWILGGLDSDSLLRVTRNELTCGRCALVSPVCLVAQNKPADNAEAESKLSSIISLRHFDANYIWSKLLLKT